MRIEPVNLNHSFTPLDVEKRISMLRNEMPDIRLHLYDYGYSSYAENKKNKRKVCISEVFRNKEGESLGGFIQPIDDMKEIIEYLGDEA